MTLSSKEYYDSDDDEEDSANLVRKGFRGDRRFALRVCNSDFNQKMDTVARK